MFSATARIRSWMAQLVKFPPFLYIGSKLVLTSFQVGSPGVLTRQVIRNISVISISFWRLNSSWVWRSSWTSGVPRGDKILPKGMPLCHLYEFFRIGLKFNFMNSWKIYEKYAITLNRLFRLKRRIETLTNEKSTRSSAIWMELLIKT